MARSTRSSLASTAKSAARKVVGRKATAKKAPAQQAPAKKAAAKKAAPTKKTPANKAAAKKAAPAKKSAAKKAAPAKKTAAKKATPAKKTAAKKATPAKKTAAKQATPAKKTAAKKAAPATKAPARTVKSPAKKAVSKKAATATKKAAPAKKVSALKVKEGEGAWTKAEIREVLDELHSERDRVVAALTELESELNGLMRDAGDGAGQDQADMGATSFERDHELMVLNNEREKLAQINRALARIEDGSYGICESCGNAIGKMRAMAFPRATLCLTCKQREERR